LSYSIAKIFNHLKFINLMQLIFAFVLLTFFNACINLGNPQGIGPSGYLYSNYTIGYSENEFIEKDTKIGEACTKRIFFFYTTGDSSIEAAAHSVGITKIKSVDKKAYNLLLFYSSLCTIVTGR